MNLGLWLDMDTWFPSMFRALKYGRCLEIKEVKMNQSDNIAELSKALAALQAEITDPLKDGENPHFKSAFASLPSVMMTIRDACSKHGLFFTQSLIRFDDGTDGLAARIVHESGQWIEYGPMRVPSKDKDDPQKAKSGVTYMRRTQALAIFGLGEADDDGNEAAKAPKKSAPKQSAKKSAPRSQPKDQPQSGALTFEGPVETVYPVKTAGKKTYCNMVVVDPDTGEPFDVTVFGKDKAERAADIEPGTWVKIEYADKKPWKTEHSEGIRLEYPVFINPDLSEIDVPH
jgi:hypothetical protein